MTEIIDQDSLTVAVSGLGAQVFPESELANRHYIQWQYFSNPAGQMIGETEVDEKGCSAHYAVIPVDYKLNNVIVKGSLSLNTMTRIDQRGKGKFRELASKTYNRLAEQGVPFTIGFPNKQSYNGFVSSLNFQLLGTVPMLIKPLNYLSFCKRVIFRSSLRKKMDNNFVINPSARFRSKQCCARIFDPLADAPLLDNLLSDIRDKRNCSLDRTGEFLRWRYDSCPTRNYIFLGVAKKDEEEFSAIVVLRTVTLMGLRCGVIVDLACGNKSDSNEALAFLINVANKQFRKGGLDAVVAACTAGCDEYDQLCSNGFFKIPNAIHPQPLRVVIRLHSDDPYFESLRNFKNWFLTFGDYDVL
jgi:hypothetical protein